jgi:LacI family transcriptional regulator
MPKLLRVALLIESSRSYGRNLLAGIAAYARAFGPWTFYHEERNLQDRMPKALKDWRPDGIIVRMENDALTQHIGRLRLPTVDVLHEEGLPGIPGVIPNQEAIAQLAVEHLLQRRLQHFAYCGLPGVIFSEQRCRHFVERLAVHGHQVHVFEHCYPRRAKGLAEIEKDAMLHAAPLAAWLRKLPKPVGVMACNDMRAYQVLSVCGEQGILVPDEVAVIGVDNDAVQCELCDPPLSSIDNNAQRAGYEAAALLHRMIQRRGPIPRLLFIDPTGVVARRSTDMLAIARREVVEVVRYVRDHVCEGLSPARLVKHTAISRSTLERWFAEFLGHSVSDEICRLKLDRVKELLITSNLPLAKIARLSGFSHVETMQRVFKSAVGQTPGVYRKRRQIVGTDLPVAGR